MYGGEGGMYVSGLYGLYVCLSVLWMCVYVCVGFCGMRGICVHVSMCVCVCFLSHILPDSPPTVAQEYIFFSEF